MFFVQIVSLNKAIRLYNYFTSPTEELLTLSRHFCLIHCFWQVFSITSCVHRRLLMNLSLLLYQCLVCLVHRIWMVLEMGGRWPYSSCFMGCCFQDLFNILQSILVQFPSSFFLIHLLNIHVVHPYNRIDTTTAWKKLRFILLDMSDFPIIDNLSIAVHVFASPIFVRHYTYIQSP